jgi:hypothetical protein
MGSGGSLGGGVGVDEREGGRAGVSA